MAKRKRKTQKKKPLTAFQIFFLGIVTGLALYWIPLDHDFSPAQFSENPIAAPVSVFAKHPPITAPLIEREGYTLAYDGRTRNAHWVYHKLTAEGLEKKTSRTDCEFQEDPLIPKHIRATKKDYQGSGLDRGHLCPAADSPSQTAMEESFFLTNIAPQAPSFNRGYWKKLEKHIRELTKHYPIVHIFSGPLYRKIKGRNGKHYVKYEVIGKQDVAVPTHFFALIFVEPPSKKMQVKGYILPNKSISSKVSLSKFLVPVEEIESASGVLFTQILSPTKT